MTYITTTSNIDGDPETFRALDEKIASNADGLLARYAGMHAGRLVVTAVWESKAHSDRFVSEHLVPTVRELFGDGPPTGVTIDFDAFDVYEPERVS